MHRNTKNHGGHRSFSRYDPFHALLYHPLLLNMTLKREVHNGFKHNVIFPKQ